MMSFDMAVAPVIALPATLWMSRKRVGASTDSLGLWQPAPMAEMTKVWHFLPMHHVIFIVYPGFELLDVSGPASVFSGANRARGPQAEGRA
jgi:hypothetical protein